MALSAKLVNPTPWDAELNWDRGVDIKIPAFDETVLTMAQMDDYRGDKPGSEAVRETVDTFGLFLSDSDRSYDHQALEALKRCRLKKKAHFDAAYRLLVDRRAAAGIRPDDDALEETLKQMGLATVRDQVKTLDTMISKLENAVGPERTVREQLDPARTIFALNPPRQFASVSAMEFFLDEHPDVKAEHEAFQKRASQHIEETIAKTETV
jgi:hypothetical protein